MDEIVREGAPRLLQQAVDLEVSEYIEAHCTQVDEQGRRRVVRNGRQPVREVLTGAGPLPMQRPPVCVLCTTGRRVYDRREQEHFRSPILPPYMRRAPSVDALIIPALYLRGVSTGDFTEALSALVGPGAKGWSATNGVRLKEIWHKEYESWRKRDLSQKHYVPACACPHADRYLWTDGAPFVDGVMQEAA